MAPERISTMPLVERGLRALTDREADGMAISAVMALQLVTRYPQWPLEVRVLTDAPAGLPALVFRNEDEALRDAVDRALLDLLGTEEHLEVARGFGFTSEEMPPERP